ncbi:MAG: hypothetical protein ACKVYV_04005 [Limisphaerales bacterium]
MPKAQKPKAASRQPRKAATRSRSPTPPAAVAAGATGGPPEVLALTRGGPEGPGGAASADFADFLTNVGKAMVRAQQDLDAESQKYAATPVGQTLPSLFRLPRVGAQMKFALEKVEGSKLGLVFFGRKSESSERYEHTLDFEVVAVPAPADTPTGPLPVAPAAPPGPGPLASPTGRDRVMAALLENAATANALGLSGPELQGRRKHLLLWPLGGDEASLFLLGHALDNGRSATLQLVFPAASGPALFPLWGPLNPAPNSPPERFARWLVEAGATQAGQPG